VFGKVKECIGLQRLQTVKEYGIRANLTELLVGSRDCTEWMLIRIGSHITRWL